MKTLIAAALAVTLTAASAQQPCPVTATALIHSYTGPLDIDQLCMTVTQHAGIPNAPGQTLRFEAVNLGDGIFKNGFEVWP